jgi:uncharacterized protein
MMIAKHQPKSPHGLQFNVAQLLKEPTGASRSYDITTTMADDTEVIYLSPLTGAVRFLQTGQNILVTGRLTVTIEKSCVRCLADFRATVTLELEEEFYPVVDVLTGAALRASPEEDDPATRIDEHHTLDLSEVIRQAFLLESDTIRYCRPDCRGLCPQCGQDLNLAQCSCREEAIDVRWAGLQALQIKD